MTHGRLLGLKVLYCSLPSLFKILAVLRIRIRSDSVFMGQPDPYPVKPDPDPDAKSTEKAPVIQIFSLYNKCQLDVLRGKKMLYFFCSTLKRPEKDPDPIFQDWIRSSGSGKNGTGSATLNLEVNV